MEPKKFLNFGERFDIEVEGHQYKSDVQDMDDEEFIYISQPMLRQAPVFIPPDTQVKVVYYRQNGMFEFPASIVGAAQKGSIRTIKLRILDEPTKYQRRMNFRVQMVIPVSAEVTSELVDTPRTLYSFRTKSIDLSESGMALKAPQSYPLETQIKVEFSVMLDGEEETFTLLSEVTRCSWPQDVGDEFVLGIRFRDISARGQRLLSKYIIQEQVRMRRRQSGFAEGNSRRW